jgi:N-acetylmuramic acid 6-phosphate etherase
MATEDVSPRFHDLDAWPTAEAARALYEGQLAAVAAVGPALPAVAAAAEAAAERLGRGDGRLAYVGAGTSGRIGVQDGAELAPTFDWPESRTLFLMAGGDGALLRAVENAEDAGADGAGRIAAAGIGPADVVVGLAASGVTPFTVAALVEAGRRGALTIGVGNNPDAPIFSACAHPILVETGTEVLAGSTRMKAGTAQKVVLNLLSTLVMIRLGRVYGGLMVDMRATNAKLRARGARMVADIAGCAEAEAAAALGRAGGELKLAVLIAAGLDPDEARARLDAAGGNLRAALKED